MPKSSRNGRSPRRVNRRVVNRKAGNGLSHGKELSALLAVGVVAALGVVLWRGRDHIPAMLARLPQQLPDSLPQLPAPEEMRASANESWKAALNRLPRLDPDKLADISRGFDALRHLFVRA